MAYANPKFIFDCEPEEVIYFEGPYSKNVFEYFKIKNLSDKRLAFRVRSTVPSSFLIEPSQGIIEPKCFVKISVLFLQTSYLEDKKKILEIMAMNKIIVEAIITSNSGLDQKALFKSNFPSNIMEHKLSCLFDFPNDITYTLKYLNDNNILEKKISFIKLGGNLKIMNSCLMKINQELTKIGKFLEALNEDSFEKKSKAD